jgi:hypothetical protein
MTLTVTKIDSSQFTVKRQKFHNIDERVTKRFFFVNEFHRVKCDVPLLR